MTRDVKEILAVYRINAVFNEDDVHLEGERNFETWRNAWQILQAHIAKKREPGRLLQYETNRSRVTCIKTLMKEIMNGGDSQKRKCNHQYTCTND